MSSDKHFDMSSDQLHRSVIKSFSSCDIPISQKISMQEEFTNSKGVTVVRQYSCAQLYDRSRRATVEQIEHTLYVDSPQKKESAIFMSPASSRPSSANTSSSQYEDVPALPMNDIMPCKSTFSFTKDCLEREGFEENMKRNKLNYGYEEIEDECEPMEVDRSTESIQNDYIMTDVHNTSSSVDNSEESPSKVSRRTFPNRQRNTRPRIGRRGLIKIFSILFVPIFCAVMLMQGRIYFSSKNSKSVEISDDNVTEALLDMLYGQREAIINIEGCFKNINNSQLIIITGGIGVGKSYAANIIAENFPYKNNVIKVTPYYKYSYNEYKYIKGLSSAGVNLVIFDGLEVGDKENIINFVKKILDSENKVMIFLFFTIPEYTIDMNKDLDLFETSKNISEFFNDVGLVHKLIIFKQLQENDVVKCVEYAMAKKGLIIDHFNMEHIVENINYNYSGCKGIHSKIALLNHL